jgi:enoyl-CoA hydratase
MSVYDKFDKVKVTQDGRLLTVAFNRPERLNAVGDGMGDQFEEVLTIVREDDSVGAVLVRGEGRAFCAGGDVKEFDQEAQSGATPPAKKVYSLLHGAKIVDLMLSVPQPMIAAVQGYAMGLGATYALFCDVVVAAEDAVFADSHVAIGLVAGDGGAVMWPLLMSLGAARWYLLTGDRISGTEAARIGLVLKAVPASELLEEATRMAKRLSEGAPLALQGTKATLNKIVHDRIDTVLAHGLLLEGATFVSDDHKEAAAAFVAKRAPQFKGH